MSNTYGGFVEITNMLSPWPNMKEEMAQKIADMNDMRYSEAIRTALFLEGLDIGDVSARFILNAIKEKIERDGVPAQQKGREQEL